MSLGVFGEGEAWRSPACRVRDREEVPRLVRLVDRARRGRLPDVVCEVDLAQHQQRRAVGQAAIVCVHTYTHDQFRATAIERERERERELEEMNDRVC